MFAAVVFDLDGTLIDSEAVAFATAREVFGPLSPAFDAGFFHALVGLDDDRAREIITAALPPGQEFIPVHRAWRTAIRARFIAEGVPLKPGVIETLERITALGLPMAVATSSLAESAAFKIERAGIGRYFQTVVVRESVVQPKPAPDAYEEAARRLGVAPAQCLAFEDSVTGAKSAHEAGMTVIQIPDVALPDGALPWPIAADLISALRHAGLG